MKPMYYTILIAIVVGAGAFFGGIQYQKSKTPIRTSGQFGTNRGAGVAGANNLRGNGGMMQGVRPIIGQILSQDATSITVKLVDGSTKIIMFSDTTPVNKTAAGSKTDLTVGTNVRVIGTTNSDGSVTAQDIQLNPITNPVQK